MSGEAFHGQEISSALQMLKKKIAAMLGSDFFMEFRFENPVG